MSRKIISVSRRTDIPAFYAKWFTRRVEEGYVAYINPFGGQVYKVSLKSVDVAAFVFWSKDFTGFANMISDLTEKGYNSYFNYTINGLPKLIEPAAPPIDCSIATCKILADIYSPHHINWRFDPIILSSITPPDYYINRFEDIASRLSGSVVRCYFSFVQMYGKVTRNFKQLANNDSIVMREPEIEEQRELAGQLADIAAKYGITMYTCCGDYLISDKIRKASCIDGELISELFYGGGLSSRKRPSRKECGCYESADIGAYDTCPFGCVYCYANVNKDVAVRRHREFDIDSPILGMPRNEALRKIWEAEKQKEQREGLF